MDVLWLTNVELPEASRLLNDIPNPFGGWMVNSSQCLSKVDGIKLSIAYPKRGINNIRNIEGERISYYAFPEIRNRYPDLKTADLYMECILKKVKPSIVHIFGTENIHTLSMVNTCKKMGICAVISIQGLVSVYALHYIACIPGKIQRRFTFRDFIKQDNIKQQQCNFTYRGLFETEAIRNVDHVIGRTTWDMACIKQISAHVKYHFCNEILREEFYKHKWSLENCERYSIFVSQASYPVKGLHFMLEAMPGVLKEYPEARLYVAGPNIVGSDSLKDRLKRSSYAKYILELIKKYNLKDKVIFTGLLDEKQMCDRYLKSNVFVCPSSIENSPNSLGEAMILGLPCIASYVGGVPDMLKHKEEGFLYPVDEPYMLSYYICEVFRDNEIAAKLSNNARKTALQIFDPEKNTNRMLDIYKSIALE